MDKKTVQYQAHTTTSGAHETSHGARDRLNAGESIVRGTANNQLVSANGHDKLVMQEDGNLVLYHNLEAKWDTKTSGTAGQRAIMQADGNFVLYSAQHTALWSSGTQGKPGSNLILQPDGNLVVYQPVAVWAANTAH